jgi:hypothetical protein
MNVNTVKKTAKHLHINVNKYPIRTLVAGFNVELTEHGKKAGKYNVTNSSPTKTLKIAMGHLTENKNYYKLLKKAKL